MPDDSHRSRSGSSSEADHVVASGPEGTEVERPPADQLYHLLERPRRRRLLSLLADSPDVEYSVDDLVSAVAEAERSEPDPESHRHRVGTALHHVHLPKLADAGVIDFDPVARTVRYDGSEAVESLLAADGAMRRREDG